MGNQFDINSSMTDLQKMTNDLLMKIKQISVQ